MLSRRELSLLRAMYLHATVTDAAASVHISQPAASALLRGLETRLGFALFTRDHRRLQLTSQGRALIPEVLNALTAMDAVDRLASDIRHGAAARLNVGAVAVASSMLLPQALARIRRAFPDVAVTVRAGTALEIAEMAVDHRIDLGIVIASTTAIAERVSRQRLARLSLYAIFPPEHPRARVAKPVTLKELSQLGLIVLSVALPAGLATKQAMEDQGLDYRPLMEVAQSFTACEFARNGLGVAIVESLGARYAQRQGLVARHVLMLADSELAVVHPKDRPLEGASQSLRDALVEIVGEMKLGAN